MRISDWSSDVCSSDLMLEKVEVVIAHKSTRCIAAARAAIDARCLRQTAVPGTAAHAPAPDRTGCASPRGAGIGSGYAPTASTGPAVAVYRTRRIRRTRAEERRVGKEFVRTCRSRWSPDH